MIEDPEFIAGHVIPAQPGWFIVYVDGEAACPSEAVLGWAIEANLSPWGRVCAITSGGAKSPDHITQRIGYLRPDGQVELDDITYASLRHLELALRRGGVE